MQRLWMKWWLCATIMVIHHHVCVSKGCFQEEKTALLDLSNELHDLRYWVNDSNSNCCEWQRVKCDSSSGHVIHLLLGNLGIYPPYGTSYFNLSMLIPFKELRTLNLSNLYTHDHSLEANLEELSSLRNLEQLDLSGNFMTIHLAPSFQGLSSFQNLRWLDLSLNRIGGTLTTKDLGYLKHLEVLALRRCNLTGTLPIKGLCEMKNLQELDLSQNLFEGTLHPCLGNLRSLRALDLSNNALTGTISSSLFAGLQSLEYLSVSSNKFEGIFSFIDLANLSNLKVLSLGMLHNTLQVETEHPPWIPSFQLEALLMPNCLLNLPTRTIPTFLTRQHSLKYINLSYNNMVGMFPSWLFLNNPKLEGVLLNDNSFNGYFQLPTNTNNHMNQLIRLDISNNKFQGQLPRHIGSFFPHLERLDVSGNMFDGEIPTSLGNMSKLRRLRMENNHFSGEIPRQMLMGCTSLDLLKLSNNSLVGPIFPGPLNLTKIRILLLDNNLFNGTLEWQEGLLGVGDELLTLDISGNQLSGSLPSWIGSLTVNFLRASSKCNNFEGAIPKELCNIGGLQLIDLSENGFSGTLPSCLGNLSIIHLQRNSLTGTIPEAFFFNGSNSLTVDLRDNKLSGNIPNTSSQIPRTSLILVALLLSGNQLQGEIPTHLCLNSNLRFLDLSRNNFDGSIPTCFNNILFGKGYYFDYRLVYGSYTQGTSHFFTPDNFHIHFDSRSLDEYYEYDFEIDNDYVVQEQVQFRTKSLTLSYEGNILSYMSGLDLSCNHLTGEIPSSMGDLTALHALNLSHNHLNGSIPASFHKLQAIESIDLSHNNLGGQIPLQLQELNSLAIFNASYNNLSGTVPEMGQFGALEDSNFIGNPYLSRCNSNRGNSTLPATPPTSLDGEDSDESVIDFSAFYGSFIASYVAVILILVAVLWINRPWRRAWFYFTTIFLNKCFSRFLDYDF